MLGIITYSYALSYNYGLIMSFFIFPTRIILGKLGKRHLLKLPILFFLSFAANLFNSYSIVYVGSILFLIRYVFEYLMEFLLTHTITTNRILRRISHLIGAYLFFSMIAMRIVNFLRV